MSLRKVKHMPILTEADLRAAMLPEGTGAYRVQPGVFVTPSARQYLSERRIELIVEAGAPAMPRTPLPEGGSHAFVDHASGKGYAKKPQRMTHLAGNRLVPKAHPRIALRGKLDTLEGEMIRAQIIAREHNMPDLCADLGEALAFTRKLLGAEVTGRPLDAMVLFGMHADELHYISHHVNEFFHFDHPVPDHSMGRVAAELNLLRAKAREVELAAEHTFSQANDREDILQALNRLSSAIYVLFCRVIAGQYGGCAN